MAFLIDWRVRMALSKLNEVKLPVDGLCLGRLVTEHPAAKKLVPYAAFDKQKCLELWHGLRKGPDGRPFPGALQIVFDSDVTSHFLVEPTALSNSLTGDPSSVSVLSESFIMLKPEIAKELGHPFCFSQVKVTERGLVVSYLGYGVEGDLPTGENLSPLYKNAYGLLDYRIELSDILRDE